MISEFIFFDKDGLEIIDTHFGGLLNAIGKRDLQEEKESAKFAFLVGPYIFVIFLSILRI